MRRHSLGDLLWRSAARTPHTIAIVYRDLRQSYRQLDAIVNRTANALAARGVGQGDRVALLSHNNHAFVVMQFALARLGAVMVPINFMLNVAEVAYILGHCGAVGLVAEDRLVALAAQAAANASAALRVRAVIPEQGMPVPHEWENIEDLMRHADASPPDVRIDDADPVQILYTSGTESRPKGVTLSSRNLISQYVSCIVDGDMSADDIEVHALPLFHCAQLHCFLTPGLYLGARNIILSAPTPSALLEAVERERATKLFCPPTIWISVLRHESFGQRDLSSLTKGYFGASIMPMEVIRELSDRLPHLRLYNFYGQTEMSPLATVLKPADQLRKLGSAGRACVNVETRVVDDEDRVLPAGEVGEIVHRGPHVMLGYWNDPERTAEAFRNGWFHSGDLGVLDDEGYLRVVDRKKDMIKTGGENVASREVEEVIYQHPAVAEVAVFGLPHPQWIEAVTAAIVLRPGEGMDEAQLVAFCRERLAGFKTPKRMLIVDALPRNASGKILKRELRKLFGAA